MKRGLRIAAYVAGGVVVLFVLVLGGVYGFSSRNFNRSYDIQPGPLRAGMAGAGEDLAERGAHLAIVRGCVDCHWEDFGGTEFANDPAFGLLWSSNLTSGEGGIADAYTDADWDRAIRHGVRPDGKPLFFMPSHEYWATGDDDLAALIAFFRSLDPVDRTRPEARPGPLARILYLAGQFPLIPAELIDHDAPRPAAPDPAPTEEYGAYLAIGCTGCHGQGYTGGKITGGDPAWGPAANLTPDPETGLGSWTQEDFFRAMREGERPDGTEILPPMPIGATKFMTDDELTALWLYLRTLEPRPAGNR
jgi:mono/diheme cytochrome c family protein